MNDGDLKENELEDKIQGIIYNIWFAVGLGPTTIKRGFYKSQVEKIFEDDEKIYELTIKVLKSMSKIKSEVEKLDDKDEKFNWIKENIKQNNNDVKNYSELKNELSDLKEELDLERVSWSSLKRIYALAFPGYFTTIVTNSIDSVIEELYNLPEDNKMEEMKLKHNWALKNVILMEELYEVIEDNDDLNDENKIRNVISEDKTKDGENGIEIVRSIFYWCLYDKLKGEIDLKKQMVYYGPPGTGKTHRAKKEVQEQLEIWTFTLKQELKKIQRNNGGSDLIKELIDNISDMNIEEFKQMYQFHPSISYEDFIEGIRPVTGGEHELEVVAGTFKRFCQKATYWYEALYRKYDFDSGGLNDKKITILGEKLLNETDDKIEENNSIPDSIENILPESFEDYFPIDKNHEENELIADIWKALYVISLNYLRNNKNERQDKNQRLSDFIPPYFFIIDEINRAELSRVLGELMYCLEYRGREGKVKTQFAYLIDEKIDKNDIYYIKQSNYSTSKGEYYYFYIPENLYLLGTMNTLDRSVESFDFALRRRFLWKKVPSRKDKLEYYLHKNLNNDINDRKKIIEKIVKSYDELNKKIEEDTLLGEEYQIGHTYFFDIVEMMNRDQDVEESLEKLWENNLKALIEEYFRGLQQGKDLTEKIEDIKKRFDLEEE